MNFLVCLFLSVCACVSGRVLSDEDEVVGLSLCGCASVLMRVRVWVCMWMCGVWWRVCVCVWVCGCVVVCWWVCVCCCWCVLVVCCGLRGVLRVCLCVCFTGIS